MRLFQFAVSVFCAAGCTLFASPPAFAADAPSDVACPRAVPKLIAFNEASASSDAAKIAAAARDAADAYRTCASNSSVNVPVEPTVNYDKTRAAQFLVVLGRAQVASGNTVDGAKSLKDARGLASEVAEWVPSAQSYSRTMAGETSSARNTDRNPSRYKSTAIEIRDAATQELAKLAAPTAGTSPVPAATPAAAASPKPH